MIFIFGSKGQIGSSLVETLTGKRVAFKSFSRDDFDFLDFEKVSELIRKHKPELIINCSAFTNVPLSETMKEECLKMNAEFPELLAIEQKKHAGAFIHYSTDYVFDGLSHRPYKEDDACEPLNYYGLSKRIGEEKIIASKCAAIILRTGWVYSEDPKCFPVKVANKLIRENTANVVIDQFGTPNSAAQIAYWTHELIRKGANNFWAFCYRYRGIYHLSCSGSACWYDFAVEVCKLLPTRRNQSRAVYPVFSSNSQLGVIKRPGYSVLDCDKFFTSFNISKKDWKECFLEEMADFFKKMELPVVARKKKVILPFTRDELIKLKNKRDKQMAALKKKQAKPVKPKKTRRSA